MGVQTLLLLLSLLMTKFNCGCALLSSLLQCQAFSDQSGLIFTPNIPDLYFNQENAARFSERAILTPYTPGVTYIYATPSEQHNCTGRSVSMQYCYEARESDKDQTIKLFTLIFMEKEELQVTVKNMVSIETTPKDTICADSVGDAIICCDTVNFNDDTNQIQIPPTAFAFGVVTVNQDVRPLAFKDTATEFNIEQYQVSIGSNFAVGSVFSLTQNTLVEDNSLRLLRFFIEPSTQDTPVDFSATTGDAANIITTNIAVGLVLSIALVLLLLLISSALIVAVLLATKRCKRNSTEDSHRTCQHQEDSEERRTAIDINAITAHYYTIPITQEAQARNPSGDDEFYASVMDEDEVLYHNAPRVLYQNTSHDQTLHENTIPQVPGTSMSEELYCYISANKSADIHKNAPNVLLPVAIKEHGFSNAESLHSSNDGDGEPTPCLKDYTNIPCGYSLHVPLPAGKESLYNISTTNEKTESIKDREKILISTINMQPNHAYFVKPVSDKLLNFHERCSSLP